MHNICFSIFPVERSEKYITDEVLRVVKLNGDHYGTESIKFINRMFDTREQAEEWIKGNDRGFYGGLAVKYHHFDREKIPASKKENQLQERIFEVRQKRDEYINANRVRDHKADFIGCKNCGSKLSRIYLRNDHCPVCETDLRSKTVLDRITGFDLKIEELGKAKRAAELDNYAKNRGKSELRWLVKYEYHS